MAKADGLLPKFLHFQTKIKYTEDQNIKVQLENVTDHDWAEVVRCKDCKYYKEGKLLGPTKFCYYYQIGTGLNTADDDFCSKGERRSDKNAG